MTTNDKLREALELIAKTGPDARQCRNIAVAALAAITQAEEAQG